MDLSDFRKQYTKGQLLASEVPPNPIILFRDWFDEVQSKGKEQETKVVLMLLYQMKVRVMGMGLLLRMVVVMAMLWRIGKNQSRFYKVKILGVR